MSSWTSRLHKSHDPPRRNSEAPAAGASSSLDAFDSYLSIPGLYEVSRGDQLLSDNASVSDHEDTRTRSHHGRSISHHLLNAFNPGKKGGKEGALSRSKDEPGHPPSKRSNDNELKTGNCPTCDSTVRYPQNLSVYRCTACLMVNDLKPNRENKAAVGSVAAGRLHGDGASGIMGASTPPLALERTQTLIDQCVVAFLERRSKESNLDSIRKSNHPRSMTKPTDHVAHDESLRVKPETGPPPSADERLDLQIGVLGERALSQRANGHSRPLDIPVTKPMLPSLQDGNDSDHLQVVGGVSGGDAKHIFRALEDYLIASLTSCDCLNASFAPPRSKSDRAASEGAAAQARLQERGLERLDNDEGFELDAKTLLVGDIGENGQWWTGQRNAQNGSTQVSRSRPISHDRRHVRIDWATLNTWYSTLVHCGRSWKSCRQILPLEVRSPLEDESEEAVIDTMLSQARTHVHRTLLKATENLLRRPGRPLVNIEDSRFLLMLLVNPLLSLKQTDTDQFTNQALLTLERVNFDNSRSKRSYTEPGTTNVSQSYGRSSRNSSMGYHSGIIKRCLGLIANLPPYCHQVLVSWLCRMPDGQYCETVHLIARFVTHRLGKQRTLERNAPADPTADLIPEVSGPSAGTPAQLHAALDLGRRSSAKTRRESRIAYGDDWQVKAAAKAMSLLFAANSTNKSMSFAQCHQNIPGGEGLASVRQKAHRSPRLPTSAFYNTLLDYADLISDFEAWESRRGKFSFCQYPMFLSIWAKIRILEHDARRQMEIKARDAFFSSILHRRAVSQYLLFRVRRDCLVDDSLRNVSEVAGSGQEETKKGLRIEFVGEEGVDAGGLRKEWFLLLVRELFDPNYGLFVYDEDSHYCYFNPNSFETSDQFFLVGVVLGLAIYNSTILDVALPPFAFRKLLASAPTYTGPSTTITRPSLHYVLEDLAEWKPSLARGLRQLLEYEGSVKETFCRDFVADVERYGQVSQVPLCANGERRPVTNENRHEFVQLYVRYLLDIAVARQFEPFKRGFFTVCAGNSLSLFRPEEIELLVRGYDDPANFVLPLKAVAIYENWDSNDPESEEQVVKWFWEVFEAAESGSQRALLAFITGSDRIPAMGPASMVIKIVCLGNGSSRLPTARTCFNTLGLYRYASKLELERKLWRAVFDSEGFGFK